MEVVIDAGHGGDDPGASANGIVEKDYTLKIAQYQNSRFKELGIPVAMTRTTDETLTSEERVKRTLDAFGNKSSVIVLVDHLNAGGGDGAEFVYALRNKDTLASIMANEIAKAGQNVRKWYQRRLPTDSSKDYYYMLRETGNTQPVLIEYGFLDGPPSETSLIKNHWKDLAEAIVRAVTVYAGVPYDNKLTGNYIVQKGDSLYSIASKFNTSVNALKLANNLITNTLTIGQSLVIPGYVPPQQTNTTYIVQKGDSLYSIATAYKISVADLKSANNLTSNTLAIGQVLKIPGAQPAGREYITYIVKTGDTLYILSDKFDISVDEIKRLNNLTSNTLTIGQTLKLPPNPSYIEPEPTESLPGIENSYTVQSGDSLYSIARKFGITATDLINLNNLTSNALTVGQVLLIPSTPSAPETTTYVVQKGDSLYSVASKFNTSVTVLRDLNNLKTDFLSVGQILNVPSQPIATYTSYTVQKGDSLYSIAEKFNTTVNDIKNANNLTSNLLSLGQTLTIPTGNRVDAVESPLTDVLPIIIRYTVLKGDTLWSIAQEHNTTPKILRDLNNLTTDVLKIGQELLVPTVTEEQLQPIPNVTVYTVHKGDTIWGIARKFSTTVAEIKGLNNLTTNIITIGEQILVPLVKPLAPETGTQLYIIKRGDTLWSIAQEFNTTVDELKGLNNLTSEILNAGKILVVPSQ